VGETQSYYTQSETLTLNTSCLSRYDHLTLVIPLSLRICLFLSFRLCCLLCLRSLVRLVLLLYYLLKVVVEIAHL
jgi:hypothetical protein